MIGQAAADSPLKSPGGGLLSLLVGTPHSVHGPQGPPTFQAFVAIRWRELFHMTDKVPLTDPLATAPRTNTRSDHQVQRKGFRSVTSG